MGTTRTAHISIIHGDEDEDDRDNYDGDDDDLGRTLAVWMRQEVNTHTHTQTITNLSDVYLIEILAKYVFVGTNPTV